MSCGAAFAPVKKERPRGVLKDIRLGRAAPTELRSGAVRQQRLKAAACWSLPATVPIRRSRMFQSAFLLAASPRSCLPAAFMSSIFVLKSVFFAAGVAVRCGAQGDQRRRGDQPGPLLDGKQNGGRIDAACAVRLIR